MPIIDPLKKTEIIDPLKKRVPYGASGSFDETSSEKFDRYLEKTIDVLATPPLDIGEKPAETAGEFGLKALKGIGNLAVMPITPITQVFKTVIRDPLSAPSFKEGIKEAGQATIENIRGFKEFFTAPLGEKAFKEWEAGGRKGRPKWWKAVKEQWLTDPVFSLLGVAGLTRTLKTAKQKGQSPVEITDSIMAKVKEGVPPKEALEVSLKAKPIAMKPELKAIKPQVREAPKPIVKPVPKYTRIEETGGIPDITKPHGLYIATEKGQALIEDLKGKKYEYTLEPKKPLNVQEKLMISHARGQGINIEASSGIKALKKLVSENEFNSLLKKNKRELINEFSKEYPNVKWDNYYDSYEILEGYAGIKARERGYDSIIGDIQEAVVLSKDILKKYPKAHAKDIEPEIVRAYEAQPEAGELAFGQKLPKTARNINLERVGADYPVKKMLLDTADRYGEQIKKAKQGKQGKITLGETRIRAEKLAADVGTTTDKLMRDIKGKTKDLDAYIIASRDVLNSSAAQLRIMLEKTAELKSPEAIKTFQEAWGRHAEIQAEVGGASSKIARALSAHRIKSKTTRAFEIIQKEMKDETFTKELLDRLAKVDLLDEASLNKFVRDSYKPKFKDYIYSFWYNNILSGPPTHLVNIGSNSAWQAFQTPQRAVRGVLDIPMSKLQGRQREFYLKEIVPSWVGYKRGLQKGLAKGLELMKTGHMDAEVTKWAKEMGPATNPFTYSPYKPLRKVAPFVEAPTRALIAEDVVFKGIAFESEIHALAMRQAIKEGHKGAQNLSKRMTEILNDPTTEMIKKASEFADYSTFTDAPGPVTSAIINLRNKVPGARLIVPFVNTIANILKRGLELTPGVGIAVEARKAPIKGARVSDVAAKQILGGLMAAYIATKYLDGEITGAAPRKPAEREAFYGDKLPWSIRFGDKWYSYRRVEPFNNVISSVAILGDAYRDKGKIPDDEVVIKIVTGLGRNLLDASYLSGASDFITALERGDQAPQQFVQFGARQASGFIPYSSLLRSVTRATEAAKTGEAKLRKPRGLVETVKAGIPGLAEDIKARVDIWGNEITLEGGAIRQFLPWKAKTISDDPVDKEMARLNLTPGMPSKKISNIELTDDLWHEYAVNSGKEARKEIEKLMRSSFYEKINDKLKVMQIERRMSMARGKERIRILIDEIGLDKVMAEKLGRIK